MKKWLIIVNSLAALFLLCLCASSWSAEDKPVLERSERIVALQKQISALEEQKGQLETEKQVLVAEGDKLSYKIDALKIQAKGGLGIIGRYRLSRNLRKARTLSEKTQELEKKLREIGSELKIKRTELEREYEYQIVILLEKLNGISQTEQRREILEKVREYQAAKEQLVKQEKVRKLEHLDITKIEIKDYDGPQEIKEKADLIKDFVGKMNDRIEMLDARMTRLKEELKTRRKLGEFAEEISFFGERIAKEEIVSDSGKETGEESVVGPDKELVMVEGGKFARNTDTANPPITETPITETQPPAAPGRMVMERNGVSADFVGMSLDRIEEEMKLLEKQRQDLKKEVSVLAEKANSFYRKAEKIGKAETKTGGKKR